MEYEAVLSSKATAFLLGLPKARQRQVMVLLERLAATPNHPGDYSECDHTGRAVQFLLIGDFVISYWPDHAVRELRIVEIDEV